METEQRHHRHHRHRRRHHKAEAKGKEPALSIAEHPAVDAQQPTATVTTTAQYEEYGDVQAVSAETATLRELQALEREAESIRAAGGSATDVERRIEAAERRLDRERDELREHFQFEAAGYLDLF